MYKNAVLLKRTISKACSKVESHESRKCLSSCLQLWLQLCSILGLVAKLTQTVFCNIYSRAMFFSLDWLVTNYQILKTKPNVVLLKGTSWPIEVTTKTLLQNRHKRKFGNINPRSMFYSLDRLVTNNQVLKTKRQPKSFFVAVKGTVWTILFFN